MERQNQKQRKERKEDVRGEEGKAGRAGLKGIIGQRMAGNWICQAQPDEVNVIFISDIHRPPLGMLSLISRWVTEAKLAVSSKDIP